jgi:hypothetical protein
MRKLLGAVLCVWISGSAAGAGDVLQQLRFSKAEAEQEVVFAVSVGQVGLSRLAKVFKPAAPETKVALVEQSLLWIKSYTVTPAFEKAYQAFRQDYKPEAPGTEGSPEDIQSAREYYNEQLAEWKQNFPATGKDALKKRLRDFLRDSANVDYNAKLVRRGNKMVFANEAYEEQSEEWKVCYRAGKEPVAKARAIAQAWLKELGG